MVQSTFKVGVRDEWGSGRSFSKSEEWPLVDRGGGGDFPLTLG